jgi:CRP-like cAMP-binding protein
MASPESNPATPTRVTQYDSGAVIEHEGATSLGWYVLLSGRVGVFKQASQIAEFSKRGAVFGEIGSILRKPRTAKLVALDPTSVMFFDCDLDELVAQHPKVAKTMLLSLAERLVKTTDDLWSRVE